MVRREEAEGGADAPECAQHCAKRSARHRARLRHAGAFLADGAHDAGRLLLCRREQPHMAVAMPRRRVGLVVV